MSFAGFLVIFLGLAFEQSLLQINLSISLSGYGVRSDGKTVFINASVCDLAYTPSNKPVVFDIQIPGGFDKG